MRYPDHHKAATRDKIVRAAGRLVRQLGIDGISIPALMREVGLTHGGFYNHFPDRDALVAEAITVAARDGAFAEGRPFDEAVAAYLSLGHVEHPEMGCVVAALGAGGGQAGRGVRGALAETARGLVARIERARRAGATPRARPSDETLRAAAQLVGAVVLARALDDDALRERVLRVARKSVVDAE